MSFFFWDFAMPPQPLSSIKRNAAVKWGAGVAFHARPKLAPLAAEAIAAWAYADAAMGDILIRMLGARAEPAARMYDAVKSMQVRFSSLTAAAKCALEPRYYEMFEALMCVTRPVARARHRLAHDLWCYSDDLPDALLLLEASASFEFFVERNSYQFDRDGQYSGTKARRSIPEFPIDRVFVYREKELTEVFNDIREVHQLLGLFIVVAAGDPSAESNYRELENEPRIQKALARLRKQSGNAP